MSAVLASIPAQWGKGTVQRVLGLPAHRSVRGRTQPSVREGGRHNAMVSDAGRKRNYGLRGDPLRQALHVVNEGYAPPLPADEVDRIASDADGWEGGEGFKRTEGGKIRNNNRANVEHAISQLGVGLQYDSFANEYLIDAGRLDDASFRRLVFAVEERFAFQPRKEYFWDAVLDIAQQNAFNPVVELFAQLEASWDGAPRLDTWLIDYAGATDTPMSRAIGRLLLIAIIRRARHPGCKFDTLAVLIGAQGCGKSTLVRLLALKDEWFSDQVQFAADGREVIEALSGHLVLEAGELASLRRASSEQLKSFLSRQSDTGRAAYARVPRKVPRSSVIIGTTNNATFLTDATGARRFLPIEVGNINLTAFARDRNQLYAEAAVAESADDAITLPHDLWPAAAEAADARRIENPITARLAEALGDVTGRIRSTALWGLLNIPLAQQQSMSAVVSTSMQELGWAGGKHRFEDGPARGYRRGEGPELIAIGCTVAPRPHRATQQE